MSRADAAPGVSHPRTPVGYLRTEDTGMERLANDIR